MQIHGRTLQGEMKMGERSSMDSVELEIKDEKEFTAAFLAEKLNSTKEDKHLFDSVKFKPEECNYEVNDSPIWFNWDDWKIQPYWYESFCKFLVLLHGCGVRGIVSLTFCDGTPYNILFNEDGVQAEIKGDFQTFNITENGLN